jgi:hypothetical protein
VAQYDLAKQLPVRDRIDTPLLNEKSDLIVTLPVRLANKFKNFPRLEILDLPVDLGPLPYAQVWDARRDEDFLNTWLRFNAQTVQEDLGISRWNQDRNQFPPIHPKVV